jgi:hypothetical protein
MKKLLVLLIIATIPLALTAQGNSQNKNKKQNKSEKVKGNQQEKIKKVKSQEAIIWEGTSDKAGKGPKPSKNQPAKVRAAFQRDYPNAVSVSWSKYRGDWTATFANGIFTSTAVYHANGERRDTRTPIPRTEAPSTIFDEILKRKPQTRVEDIIKIEVPQQVKDIFRVKTILDGVTKFLFFTADGKEVPYNY